MKPLSEQDHYEVLEVGRDAPREGIERAYRLARSTYAEDSLAGYSIVRGADSEAIRERIETAYRVLSDEGSRRAYDAALRAVAEPAPPESPPPPEVQEVLDMEAAEVSAQALEPFEDLDEEPSADFDGPRLRRSRMRRGLELDDVARATKVNPTYLRFLEEERFEELPARVYVRGFVALYASCLGLEPKSVAEDYMRRFDAQHPARRGRSAPR
jgi:flagellar biosynthesis protein FlhG